MTLADQGHLAIDGARLEYRMIGPRPDAAPTIVMLHEGLGSVSTWGDFPQKLAEKTGAGVFVYSRAGYGKSSTDHAAAPARLHAARGDRRAAEAARRDRLPARHAARPQRRRVDRRALRRQRAGSPRARARADGAAFLRRARAASRRSRRRASYETTDLRARLARHHADVDAAFRGWNDAWLDPQFASTFDITEALAYIRVPVLVVQGAADPYGTLAQVRVVEDECYCPVETLVMPGVGHAPHREKPEETLDAVAAFADRIFRVHGEGLKTLRRFTRCATLPEASICIIIHIDILKYT